MARIAYVALILAVMLGLAEGTGARLRATAKAIFGSYTSVLRAAECNCNCCISEPRRPSQVKGDVTMMCSTPPENDPRVKILKCPYKCTVVNDPILPSTNEVEQNRFCFYHCRPTASTLALQNIAANSAKSAVENGGRNTDTDCVPITAEEIGDASSPSGNGRDPMLPPSP